ncbi:hypothetical protein FH972_026488 [Carpinus fangiana]|uniref:Peptidase S8/S53 domain-containing protein n=1 Tax=Carpinus fangiana TaxID=176857 RepID=A0A5N6L441_9ROSI|nr:hypothetical protein FH972_026488 [Carpinus fangiana]
MRYSLSLLAAAGAMAAPIIAPRDAEAPIIPGKYIVVLKNDAASDVLTTSMNHVISVLGANTPQHVYNMEGFKGYAITAEDALINSIKDLAEVDYIEPDTIVRTKALTSQTGAPWGLGRISHRAKGSTTYIYDNTAGAGTYSYIIDTGIYTSHPDFGGRATFGANYADSSNTDGNGHGTHVAGTTGSTTYGVAKKTNLIAVKVLGSDGSGTNSGVISGINWAANDAKNKGRIGKAVANMSLGGSFSTATNNAVRSATSAGLFMAVAAGNESQDAGNTSPASESTACTVGATDKNDVFAYFSNFGSYVDILAPGVDIISTWNNGGTNTISGTSMATPHITGLGAYLLALEGTRTPAALCDRIKALSTKNVVTSVPSGTTNALAYNGNGA